MLASFVHLQQKLMTEGGCIFLNLVRVTILYVISNCVTLPFFKA